MRNAEARDSTVNIAISVIDNNHHHISHRLERSARLWNCSTSWILRYASATGALMSGIYPLIIVIAGGTHADIPPTDRYMGQTEH
jgi:hypothetical protein